MRGSGFVANWGSTAAERKRAFGCDLLVEAPDIVLYRAVTVDAPVGVMFRWLCQLSQAPYSYDLLDNRGRRSPRVLTAGTENLRVGQRMTSIFELADYEPDEQLTLLVRRHRLFGDLAVTYLAAPTSPARCRLVVKLAMRAPSGLASRVSARLLPVGDLVMMRRQLLNLKARAEATFTTETAGAEQRPADGRRR